MIRYLFISNNPFAFQRNEAPEDANPSTLRKPGKKCSNPAQFIPRTSKELQGNLEDYHQLQAIFEPLFEWIADVVCLQISSILIFNNILFHQMAKVLPEHTKILQQWVNIPPSNEFSPVFPFSGLVINVNMAMRTHRDWEDLSLCLVFEISDCKGGELCMMEPKLVLHLRNGNAVAFSSHKITYFNLNFKGKRASLVFHSDKAGLAWCKDGNGWKGNKYFTRA